MPPRLLPAALLAAAAIAATALPARAQQNPAGLARPGTAQVRDAMDLETPQASRLGGLLGTRFGRSEKNRLLEVDEDELLAGFRHRPGKQAWIGEHVGKFLHAASLAWANTGDPVLRQKLDRVAAGLMATQEPDGYLGTYTPETRFGLYPNADWDVWVHKYDLLGLLAYYQYTGNKAALDTCRRIGDLLIATFGPGKKSINSAGTHMGMASGSVLEPMVLLYRATADPRYLDFARYIVRAWDEPNGPHVVSALMRTHSVAKTANGKAYEMLSDLNGLCELYRATGEKQYLEPVLLAWDDIVKHRLYITGSGSAGEHWQPDYHLPNGSSASICETCVTVTWEQLNLQLLRLTGEAKYADQLERSVYNHLLGAQKPTGDDWCYYTPLQGVKPYDSATTCCHSSGPRGVALLPTFTYGSLRGGLAVNLFTPSQATLPLPGGASVKVTQQTGYPFDGRVTLILAPKGRTAAVRFPVLLRVPAWSPGVTLAVNGKPVKAERDASGYAVVERAWKPGDRLIYTLRIPTRLVPGDHENAGRAAVMVGPIVLAADEGHNPDLKPLARVELLADDSGGLRLHRTSAGSQQGEPVFETRCAVAGVANTGTLTTLRLVPFYSAGQDGSRFEVWMPRPGMVRRATSLLSFGDESRSRQGNQGGSINDGDPASFVVTFDNTRQVEAWFAVELARPATINRVVFSHGHSFHDGGWFDTSAGKPRVQVRKTKDGPWEDVGELADYPDSTAMKWGRGLTDGRAFTVRFPPVEAWAVRVVGTPAYGDNPAQSFSSCGELAAYYDR